MMTTTQPISKVTPAELGALERIVSLLEELVDQGKGTYVDTAYSLCETCGNYHVSN